MQTIRLNNGINMPMLGFGVFRIDNLAVCEEATLDKKQPSMFDPDKPSEVRRLK